MKVYRPRPVTYTLLTLTTNLRVYSEEITRTHVKKNIQKSK